MNSTARRVHIESMFSVLSASSPDGLGCAAEDPEDCYDDSDGFHLVDRGVMASSDLDEDDIRLDDQGDPYFNFGP